MQKHGAHDPELQGLHLEPLELEPEIPVPSCELCPIQELSLREAGISTVIHCTGYKLNFQALIDLPDLYGEQNYPIQERGAATHHPGLYFLGLSWMYKWKSAVLCGIAEDAQHVARLATERSEQYSASRGSREPVSRRVSVRMLPERTPEQLTGIAWQQTWECHYDLIEERSDQILRGGRHSQPTGLCAFKSSSLRISICTSLVSHKGTGCVSSFQTDPKLQYAFGHVAVLYLRPRARNSHQLH